MMIGILGGAFDPLTLGHLDVAEFVLKHTKMERIWLMPVWRHPFEKQMASYPARVRMIQLGLSHRDYKITWSTYERDRELSGKTWETLRSLKRVKAHKQDEFYWIIGTDESLIIDSWANVEWLKKNARFVVVPRQGFKKSNPEHWIYQFPNIDLSDKGKVGNTSSTAAREAARNNNRRKLRQLIPQINIDYIKTNELYATPNAG